MAKLVVADDSRTQRSTIAMALERRGHQVVQASDGLEALHFVQEQHPDLLVSDIVMPELTGYQLCRLLKNDPATADLPIILLTTLDHQEHRFWGKEAGADSYVLKGADAAPLEAEVERLLEERQSRPRVGRVASNTLSRAHSAQARLTDLLDRLLFEATISNRMRETASLGGGVAAVGNSLCDFFYELIDYEMCVICVRGPSGPELLVRMATPFAADGLEAAKETILRERLLAVGKGESLSVKVLNPEMLKDAAAETKNLTMVSARFTRSKEGGLAVFIANRAPYSEETNETLRIAAAELEPILSATLQADALEKLKADFTAMIIHDLRAPLTAIMSAAAIVEDGLVGPVNDEQKNWMGKIGGQSRTLLDLINDFLDLSKIEAGRLDLVLEDIELATIVAATLDDYAVLLREKKIALSARLDEVGCSVQGDRTRLGQVFANLLSNAIKFTSEGGSIEIGAAREGDDEVRIWVKDTGVGIPPNEIEGLFEKYRQAQSGRISKHKGTGLGLAICKMIVESHGGKIWVNSREREGATFHFTLRQGKENAAGGDTSSC